MKAPQSLEMSGTALHDNITSQKALMFSLSFLSATLLVIPLLLLRNVIFIVCFVCKPFSPSSLVSTVLLIEV
jgi:hypothetical protein